MTAPEGTGIRSASALHGAVNAATPTLDVHSGGQGWSGGARETWGTRRGRYSADPPPTS